MTFRDEREPGTIGQIILHTNSKLNSVLDNYEPKISSEQSSIDNADIDFFQNRGNSYSNDVDDDDEGMSIPRDDNFQSLESHDSKLTVPTPEISNIDMQDMHGKLAAHLSQGERGLVSQGSQTSQSTQANPKKKGKSTNISENAETKYWRVKLHYDQKNQKMPFLFRKDGIRKKIKTHFFKWIKKLLDKKNELLFKGEKKIKFKKLHQDTISSINLNFNSFLLQQTVYEIYSKDCKQNENLIEKLKKKMTETEEFSTSKMSCAPLSLLYNDYLNSPQFAKDLKKIEKDIEEQQKQAEPEDKEFILLYVDIYKEYCKFFVDYFTKTLANQRSKPTNKKRSKSEALSNSETTCDKTLSNGEIESF